MVGIICPPSLVEIGVTDMPKSRGALVPLQGPGTFRGDTPALNEFSNLYVIKFNGPYCNFGIVGTNIASFMLITHRPMTNEGP